MTIRHLLTHTSGLGDWAPSAGSDPLTLAYRQRGITPGNRGIRLKRPCWTQAFAPWSRGHQGNRGGTPAGCHRKHHEKTCGEGHDRPRTQKGWTHGLPFEDHPRVFGPKDRGRPPLHTHQGAKQPAESFALERPWHPGLRRVPSPYGWRPPCRVRSASQSTVGGPQSGHRVTRGRPPRHQQ
jgi:hypothetical protein